MGVLLMFPLHRRRSGGRVFAALAEASRLEQAERRLVWACALASIVLNVALALSTG